MFEKVDPKQSFPEMEEKILKYWQDNGIFEKSVERRKDNEKFVFFDEEGTNTALIVISRVLVTL